jgi:hypothetical protein
MQYLALYDSDGVFVTKNEHRDREFVVCGVCLLPCTGVY